MWSRLLFFVLMLLTARSFAQDTIVMQNKVRVSCRLLEIGINDIRYRNFNQPEGPDRVISKSQVLFVRYSNGDREFFDAPAPTMKPRLYLAGARIMLDNKYIPENKLLLLFETVNDEQKRIALTALGRNLKQVIKEQHRNFLVGLPMLLGTFLTFGIAAEELEIEQAVALATAQAVTGGILIGNSILRKKERQAIKEKICRVYNE